MTAVGRLRRPGVALGSALALLFMATALTFVLVSLIPGDAARGILGPQAPAAAYAKLHEELGLDRPLLAQYGSWLRGVVLHGDLGTSMFSGESVTHMLGVRLPVTLSLLIGSLLVTAVAGTAIGLVGALRTGGLLAWLLDSLSIAAFAMPGFWVGAILIDVFADRLGWFPATGYVPIEQSLGGWLQSITLPVLALALAGSAAVAKQTRDAVLAALESEYVRLARANGVPERSIVFRHALKNAGARIVTMIGLAAVGVVGGAVVIETVFGLPGLGLLAVNATGQRDLPVVQGVVLYFTVFVVAINLLVNLAQTALDPKGRRV